jgi:hypothetical protein
MVESSVSATIPLARSRVQATAQQKETVRSLRGRQKKRQQKYLLLSFTQRLLRCRRRSERYPHRRNTVAARKCASLFYDGLVASFVSGTMELMTGESGGLCDTSRASRKSEAVQSSAADTIKEIKLLPHAFGTRTARRLPRLSDTFCPAERAVLTVPAPPPSPLTRVPCTKQTKDKGEGCD